MHINEISISVQHQDLQYVNASRVSIKGGLLQYVNNSIYVAYEE